MKALLFGLVLLLGVLMYPAGALAHSVQTDFQMFSESLNITSTFSTGDPFEGAEIVVYAPGDETKPWMEGTTDDRGSFVFNPDPALEGEWRIEIGQGDHGDILTVPVSDQGIEFEEISQVNYDAPHYGFANQLVIAGAALSSGLGTWLFKRKRQF